MTEYPSNYMTQKPTPLAREYSAPGNRPEPAPPLLQTDNAKRAYENLAGCILNFEKSFDDEQEIGARLVTHGSSTTLHLHNISYYNPDLLSFHGTNEEGEELLLVQHVSQLNLLLVPLKKLLEKPLRIGYKLQRTIED